MSMKLARIYATFALMPKLPGVAAVACSLPTTAVLATCMGVSPAFVLVEDKMTLLRLLKLQVHNVGQEQGRRGLNGARDGVEKSL